MPVSKGHPYYKAEQETYQKRRSEISDAYHPSTAKLVLEYLDEKEGSSARTYLKERTSITTLRNISAMFVRLAPVWKKLYQDKPFNDPQILQDKHSLKPLRLHLNKTYDNGHTVYDFRKNLVPFFKHLCDGIQPVCLYELLQISQPQNNQHYGKGAYTEEEIQAMIDTSGDAQDKCIVAMLKECPVRGRSSLLLLNKKDIEFLTLNGIRYAKIHWMQGKTGAFETTMYQSLPYLEQWMALHPLRDRADYPIFVNTKGHNKLQTMGYNAFRKRFHAIWTRAQIKFPSIASKPHHPHWMRASGFSILEEKYGSTEAAVQGGWVPDSKQLKKYRNRAGESHMRSRMTKDGISVEKKNSVVCLKCQTANESTQEYCLKCGSPVNPKSLVDYEQKVAKQMEEKMMGILQEYMNKTRGELDAELQRLRKVR